MPSLPFSVKAFKLAQARHAPALIPSVEVELLLS
jgi:hypothetical protein